MPLGFTKTKIYAIICSQIAFKEVIFIQSVNRKDSESFESLMRRFNRKVQQSGNLPLARKKQHFEKEISKREAREIAIRKKARKDNKNKMMMLKGF